MSDNLPVVPDRAVSALVDWFIENEPGMLRPREWTAKVMAYIILAYDQRVVEFPTRLELAEHLGINVPSIDVVLSQRQGTKDIRIISHLKKSSVRGEISTIRYRQIIPKNEAMIAVVRAAANPNGLEPRG